MGSNNPGNQNPVAGAITYPAASTGEVQPAPVQPRQPRNLQGLLRFAMEATKIEDAPAASQHAPMDEERRRFLEQALKSLTVDLVELLRNSIATLSDPEKISSARMGEDPPADVTAAFDQLEDTIDDIDVANDFYKLGGFSIFPVCFGSDCEKIRARAAFVLGELCQNNPFCQARALESGLLNVVLHLVESESGHALAKCLYALSCACREFDPACRELIAQGGCGSLARLLSHEECAARTKAAFFTTYLAKHYPEAKAQFLSSDALTSIATGLEREQDSSTEHLIMTLLTLTSDLDPEATCRLGGRRLRSALQGARGAAEDLEEGLEKLLRVLEEVKDADDEVVDR